ncbi:hypothetical protein [Actinocorallia longicatena]|uniref:Uncharacterized protein n=1 Tax=Actinocorallia longicatena TaxID=111803 RepID=A0ABP6Q479_9ACTN
MSARQARQRPGNARAPADGMKLHRRSLRLDGRPYTVVTPRPGTTARFSTNFFHETWHVLSDDRGARLFGRLLWGLAYQARPGTVVAIGPAFLDPTPFDADPADPIVLLPAWHTGLTPRAIKDLRTGLRRGGSDGTVRWRTPGLDAALADVRGWYRRTVPAHHHRDSGDVTRAGGAIVLRPGSALEARTWAVSAADLDSARYGTDHAYLGEHGRWPTGEVQIFRNYREKIGTARRARAEVLRRPGTPAGPDALRRAVWDQVAVIRAR